MRPLLLLLAVLFAAAPAAASIGDNLPEFKACVKASRRSLDRLLPHHC